MGRREGDGGRATAAGPADSRDASLRPDDGAGRGGGRERRQSAGQERGRAALTVPPAFPAPPGLTRLSSCASAGRLLPARARLYARSPPPPRLLLSCGGALRLSLTWAFLRLTPSVSQALAALPRKPPNNRPLCNSRNCHPPPQVEKIKGLYTALCRPGGPLKALRKAILVTYLLHCFRFLRPCPGPAD